jgi:predicted AAA+ superfamily ATPase
VVLINELVRPREEVLTEGIEGRVDVCEALSGEGIEGDAQKFLEVTYLTEPLKEVIDEIRMKLEKKKGSKGVYAFQTKLEV